MMMFDKLTETIDGFDFKSITDERKEVLNPLIEHLRHKINRKEIVRLNFVCTHNSRRSHLAQIWSQTAAVYFNIEKVACYSGGTEATAMFPLVAETLEGQGFKIQQLSSSENPVYSIKMARNAPPMIGFSKRYDHDFNPGSDFTAIMTCSHADENCPLILGADNRISITYEDPKAFDNSPLQIEKYLERSTQIATEMFYVFGNI